MYHVHVPPLIGAQEHATHMTNGTSNRRSIGLLCVAGDVQFWVPTVVLVGGLLLLRWIS
jgi:hypothetical protein